MSPHLLGPRTSLQHQQECYGRRGPIACVPLSLHLHWTNSSSDTYHLTMVAKASSIFLFLEKETCTVLNILIYLAEAMELSMNHLTGFVYGQPHDLAVTN